MINPIKRPLSRNTKDNEQHKFDEFQERVVVSTTSNTLNSLVSETFDEIEIIQFNSNQDPVIVVYRNEQIEVARLTITYNNNNDIQRVIKS